MTDKASTRKMIKARISLLGGMFRNEYSTIICDKLKEIPEFINSNKVFIYISFDNEVHTKDIIKYSLLQGKKVYVPNIIGNTMNMIEIDKDTVYSINNYGIVEPIIDKDKDSLYDENIDVAIMPLIAYDRYLSRLGRGGGFYDKFLSNRECTKIAIAFSVQEVDKLLVEPHDIKVDMIITEKGIIR